MSSRTAGLLKWGLLALAGFLIALMLNPNFTAPTVVYPAMLILLTLVLTALLGMWIMAEKRRQQDSGRHKAKHPPEKAKRTPESEAAAAPLDGDGELVEIIIDDAKRKRGQGE